ncbi:hypothetical protein FFY77_12705 [Xanthomonas translucens pv. translucens]|nr:hypothetical protein [Xanthomonas translucens pv. translucens]
MKSVAGDRGPGTGDRGPGTGDRGPGTGDRGPGTGDRQDGVPAKIAVKRLDAKRADFFQKNGFFTAPAQLLFL